MKLRYIIFTICLVVLSSITSVSLKAWQTDCTYSTDTDGSITIRVKPVSDNSNYVTFWIATYTEEFNGKTYLQIPTYSSTAEGVDVGGRKYFAQGVYKGNEFIVEKGKYCPTDINIYNIKNTNKAVICASSVMSQVCNKFNASNTDTKYSLTEEKTVDYTIDKSPLCTRLNMVWTILGYIIFAIQIVTPLVLIIMGSLGMAKAVTADKENKIKDAQDLLVKRIIAAVLVFLLIFITKVAVNLVLGNKYEKEWQACVHCALNPFDSKNGCGIKTVEFIIPEGD